MERDAISIPNAHPDRSQSVGEADLAAGGHATGPLAVEDAVGRGVAGLGGAAPSLVLVFPAAGSPAADAAARARACVPGGCEVAGMTSDGLITPAGVGHGGCSALAFGPEVSAGVGIATGASADLREAGRAAVHDALIGLEPVPGRSALLLLLDPLSGDEGDAIDGAYSVVGA